jgi:hypothetical protein
MLSSSSRRSILRYVAGFAFCATGGASLALGSPIVSNQHQDEIDVGRAFIKRALASERYVEVAISDPYHDLSSPEYKEYNRVLEETSKIIDPIINRLVNDHAKHIG